MRYAKLMLLTLGVFGMQMAGATPTPEEAAQLGKTLTPLGAIKAGNKEGTIPEWTGGLCTPPANYKPLAGAGGGPPWVDPYVSDKPLFKITPENLAQYADKVDAANKELFRRFPKTYYMNVYPSHRSACYPQWINDNTIKRVMNPKIVGGDVPSVTGAHAQFPFPIPKSGPEAMWNANLIYTEVNFLGNFLTFYVDSSGTTTMADADEEKMYVPFWDNSKTSTPDDQPYYMTITNMTYPPNMANTGMVMKKFLRQDLRGDPTWSYIPGQRRVRLAPDFSYDGVAARAGGTILYDEFYGWSGKMDRFDFKLIGRKEYYIPYNSNGDKLASKSAATANHLNPEAARWELHRVWEVEATLKPNERHVQKKKVWLIDEDSWSFAAYWAYDQANKINHIDYWQLFQAYDKQNIFYHTYQTYDLTKGAYTHWLMYGPGDNGIYAKGYRKAPAMPESTFSPESMAGRGLR